MAEMLTSETRHKQSDLKAVNKIVLIVSAEVSNSLCGFLILAVRVYTATLKGQMTHHFVTENQ